jgi:hypothetical protein
MSTQPLDTLLNRDRSKAMGKDVINIASPLLQEEIHYASNMLGRCLAKRSIKEEDIAPLLLFMHIIEMTDAIEILISQSCPDPATNIVRSSFEALLQLEYMVEDNFEDRAIAFIVKNNMDQKEMLEVYDETTSKGKIYDEICQKDIIHGKFKLSNPEVINKIKEEIDKIKSALDNPKYLFFVNQLENKNYWFSFSHGPNNFKDLALHLKKGRDYYDLYKPWSIFAHAQDGVRFISNSSDINKLEILSLRRQDQIPFIAYMAHSYIMRAIICITDKYLHDEWGILSQWRITEVKPYTDVIERMVQSEPLPK